jgi:hypothetical protein
LRTKNSDQIQSRFAIVYDSCIGCSNSKSLPMFEALEVFFGRSCQSVIHLTKAKVEKSWTCFDRVVNRDFLSVHFFDLKTILDNNKEQPKKELNRSVWVGPVYGWLILVMIGGADSWEGRNFVYSGTSSKSFPIEPGVDSSIPAAAFHFWYSPPYRCSKTHQTESPRDKGTPQWTYPSSIEPWLTSRVSKLAAKPYPWIHIIPAINR